MDTHHHVLIFSSGNDSSGFESRVAFGISKWMKNVTIIYNDDDACAHACAQERGNACAQSAQNGDSILVDWPLQRIDETFNNDGKCHKFQVVRCAHARERDDELTRKFGREHIWTVCPRDFNDDKIKAILGGMWLLKNPAPTPLSKDFGNLCILCSADADADADAVLKRCLALAESEWKAFPGTHPVHITRRQQRRDRDYYVSLKMDGTRFMMIIDRQGRMWFIDRKLSIWKGPGNRELLARFSDSLLDVEVVSPGFVTVIDVIAFQGRCIRGFPLLRRLDSVLPLCRTLSSSAPAPAPIRLNIQSYYKTWTDMRKVLDLLKIDGFRKYDGLVFTPATGGYRLGRNSELLKWKPAGQNTVDFLYVARSSSGTVFAQDKDNAKKLIPYGRVFGVPLTVKSHSIIECLPVGSNSSRWKFYKHRHDRSSPNADWVVDNVMESHRENITEDDLVGWFDTDDESNNTR